MKNKIKIGLSAMIAVVLVFLGSNQIAAAPGDANEDPALAIHLTKTLVSPDPTITALPVDMTFEFEATAGVFKPHGSDVVDTTVVAPTLTIPSLTFTKDDIGTVANGAKVTHKQTGDLLQVFRDNIATLSPGVYEYTVSEKADTVSGLNAANERVEYDSTTYTLRIYISRGANGESTLEGGTIEGPDGKEVAGPGTVVPGAPGDNEIQNANGFNFRNVYSKDAGTITPPDPTKPNAGFIVDNVIEGTLAKPDDIFTYEITLVSNATVARRSFILDVAGTQHTITPGTTFTFDLKGGERAWLLDVPVGLEVQVEETEYGYYTPSVATVEDGTKTIDDITSADYVAGTSATVVLGENSNLAAYKNVWDKTTPTGIFINNLPYIALILVASSGIFMSAVIKRKVRA